MPIGVQTTCLFTPSAETLAWLVERYYESAEFKGLNKRTQHVRKLILGHVCKADGAKPYKLLETRHIRRARDLKAHVPESANGMVKALRALFTWAVQPGVELATVNPAKDVPYLQQKGDGFHSWTDAEVLQFEQRHPLGTKARLALALLLYLAQRRSDIVLFGPSHVVNGWICFTQQKNKDREGKAIYLEIPIQPELQAVLDASPLGKTHFLVNEWGKPFNANTFGNWFRDRCDEAGLKHCTSHGLRKAAARRLAEAGASGHEIKSVTGHTTLKEVDRYTKAAQQPILAQQAFAHKQKVPLFEPHYDGGTKGATKPLIIKEDEMQMVPGTGTPFVIYFNYLAKN